MSTTSKSLEITRLETSLGPLIVVSHETGVRAGQAFQQRTSDGAGAWYALCVDWYGHGIPPIQCRVPERGGYSTLDDLEEEMAREVTAQMKTDYWGDR
jgi:hypothetical protein